MSPPPTRRYIPSHISQNGKRAERGKKEEVGCAYLELSIRLQRPRREDGRFLICGLDWLRGLRANLETQPLACRWHARHRLETAFELGNRPRRRDAALRSGILGDNEQGNVLSGGHGVRGSCAGETGQG
jgi:hypothetical protein